MSDVAQQSKHDSDLDEDSNLEQKERESTSPQSASTSSTAENQNSLYSICRGVFFDKRPANSYSFCDCPRKSRAKSKREVACKCGEEDAVLEWKWDDGSKSVASYLSEDHRDVSFHVNYSAGTAAVKGSDPMTEGQYYWEVKMTTPVYGTDMMVGVGTQSVDINSCTTNFCSLLGRDEESWGLSYFGVIHHMGKTKQYTKKFGQGTIIGVHLDMWHGTLEFYKNRIPQGIAYKGLQSKTLYPMVCSTAARSGMRVISSSSFRTSLQFLCCQSLRRLIPKHLDVVDALHPFPPGLRAFLVNNLGWLMRPTLDPMQAMSIAKGPSNVNVRLGKRSSEHLWPNKSDALSEDDELDATSEGGLEEDQEVMNLVDFTEEKDIVSEDSDEEPHTSPPPKRQKLAPLEPREDECSDGSFEDSSECPTTATATDIDVTEAAAPSIDSSRAESPSTNSDSPRDGITSTAHSRKRRHSTANSAYKKYKEKRKRKKPWC